MPAGEELLGLIDCTVLGSAKNALLFGRRAAYYHNGWTGKTPGAGVVPYEAFPSRQFGLEGTWEVSLGNNQFVDTSGCSVPREIIIEILREIQREEAIRPEEPCYVEFSCWRHRKLSLTLDSSDILTVLTEYSE